MSSISCRSGVSQGSGGGVSRSVVMASTLPGSGSYRRSQTKYPAPQGLILPLPGSGEEPNRIMGGAPGQDEAGDMYWFVEAITSRQIIEASRPNAKA